MQRPTSRLAVIVALLAPAGASALAQQPDAECRGVTLDDTITVARVAKGHARLHFVLGPEDGRTGCPSSAAQCRDRAYLVPGDAVLTLPGKVNGHVCAAYAGKTGRETFGWLPADALAQQPAAKAADADWLGSWRRTEAAITITRAPDGALTIRGAATYGAADPRRVASGAVNTGELSGKARGTDGMLLIADDGVASPAAAKDTCAAQLRLAGPYLIVEDNNRCGGMNVSFTGLYVKRRSRR